MMPLGDVFMSEFGINPSQFSLLVSAYAIGAFLSCLAGAVYVDRFDRKRALSILYAGFALGTLACALATNYYALLSIRFITGLFGGVLSALVLSVVADTFTFERRGRAMGILMGAFSAASALGVPVGLYLADHFIWQAPFLFIGGFGLCLLALILVKFPTMRGHLEEGLPEKNFVSTFSSVLKDRNQVNALLAGIALVLGHFLIIPFIAPYMMRNVGFDTNALTAMYFVGGLVTVFTSPLIGRLTDRFGVMRVMSGFLFLSFIPVVAITNMPPIGVTLALLFTTAFFVTGTGRMIPPQTLISAAVGPETRGSFMSLKGALQQLAIALSAAIGGVIVVFDEQEKLLNYEWVGYLSIVVCLLALWLVSRLKVAEGN